MPIEGLTAYAHVADVQRSVDFYRRLGLKLRNSHEEDGRLVWAFVTSPAADPNDAGARLMVAPADGAVEPSQQAVLFYCWSPDVEALHAELRDAGIAVGTIEYPFYMPAGEFRVVDPDGYVLLVGQLSAANSRARSATLSRDVRCDACEPRYFATSTARDSRITVTLTWPGYSS